MQKAVLRQYSRINRGENQAIHKYKGCAVSLVYDTASYGGSYLFASVDPVDYFSLIVDHK